MDREIRIYIWTYTALMALLAVTVASVFIELGVFHPVVNLGIAIAKALLIMTFFMHLWESSNLVRLFAVGGAFWLLLLFGLSMGDYTTRPEGAPGTGFAGQQEPAAPEKAP